MLCVALLFLITPFGYDDGLEEAIKCCVVLVVNVHASKVSSFERERERW